MRPWRRGGKIRSIAALRGALVPFLAIVTAFAIGAVIIFFAAPEGQSGWETVVLAYSGLFRGSVGQPG